MKTLLNIKDFILAKKNGLGKRVRFDNLIGFDGILLAIVILDNEVIAHGIELDQPVPVVGHELNWNSKKAKLVKIRDCKNKHGLWVAKEQIKFI